MKKRVLKSEEREYKNLVAAAALLEAVSKNDATYVVRDVYLDLGQGWMWTTICREGFRECQVLYPRDWEKIVTASTVVEIGTAVLSVMSDKYFGDK